MSAVLKKAVELNHSLQLPWHLSPQCPRKCNIDLLTKKKPINFCFCAIIDFLWSFNLLHICDSKLTIIGSDNCLSPGRCQAIIWTNAAILLMQTLGTNLSEILSKIHTFSFRKIHLKKPSMKWCQFCLGLNVLTLKHQETHGCVVSTVATDYTFNLLDQFHMKILHFCWTTFGNKITYWKKNDPVI